MTQRRFRLLVAVLVLSLLAAACGSKPAAQPAPDQQPSAQSPAASSKLTQPVTLRIATGPQGTGWYSYGASFAEVLKKDLPAGSTFDVLPKALGIGNVTLLNKGEADIGFLFTVTAAWADKGVAAFKEKQTNVKSLIGGLDTYYCGAMLSKSLGVQSLKDVADKKVPVKIVTQNPGSQADWCAKQVLEFYKVTPETIKSWGGSYTATDNGTISQLAKDGKADLILTVLTAGHPTYSEIALAGTHTFVPLPDDMLKFLIDTYGFTPADMPPKTFPNQEQPVKLAHMQTTLAARADLPDDVAYAVTKGVIENMPTLRTTYKALDAFKPELACKPELNGVALHPGAARYYKEKGCLK